MKGDINKSFIPTGREISDHQDTMVSRVFQPIKKDRGSYFVHYTPARPSEYFASLALVFLERIETARVAQLMEQECDAWIKRYPVPLMVTSFDDSDSVLKLADVKGCDNLIGIVVNGQTVHKWELLKNGDFPDGNLSESHLLKIYQDLSSSTASERREQALKQSQSMRYGIFLIALWGLIIPIAVFVIGLVGLAYPILSIAIIVYSLGKAIIRALKMTGHFPKSVREKKKEAEELEMCHHHYHCKLNPEGFARLKIENFERETREDTRKEAEKIRIEQSSKREDGK